MAVNQLLKKLFKKIGISVSRYREQEVEKQYQFLQRFGIDTILDIGANKGQYALHKRHLGYTGRIVSFEPVSDAYNILKQKSASDSRWEISKIALGDYDGEAEINVAGNSYSSSLLDMLPAHEKSAPDSAYYSKEKIIVHKLDTIFDQYCKPSNSILMKIDTQGFEKNVLDGAAKTLPLIKGLQLEMSIIPLYKDEMLFLEMMDFIQRQGFKLFLFENGFSDPDTGQLLQVDGIFYR